MNKDWEVGEEPGVIHRDWGHKDKCFLILMGVVVKESVRDCLYSRDLWRAVGESVSGQLAFIRAACKRRRRKNWRYLGTWKFLIPKLVIGPTTCLTHWSNFPEDLLPRGQKLRCWRTQARTVQQGGRPGYPRSACLLRSPSSATIWECVLCKQARYLDFYMKTLNF